MAARTRRPLDSTPTTEPLLYDRDQLCEMLNTSRATLDRSQSAGKLPRPLRLGGQRRWRAEEVREWIRAGMPSRDEWERRQRHAAG